MDLGHLLITGSMRSGTTYVGHVLSCSSSLHYIHEPFNYVRGIEGIEHWLPYSKTQCKIGRYAQIVDKFMSLDFTYKNPRRDAWWRRWGRATLGSRSAWRARMYKWIHQHHTRMLIKDPTAVFLSKYFHEQKNTNVVLLVRHPMAFYYSNKRLKWDFDFSHIIRQKELVQDHLAEEIAVIQSKELNYAQRIGMLWRIIYKVAAEFTDQESESGGWIVCLHEDICRFPHEQFKRIVNRFGYDMNSEMESYIDQTTSASNAVEARKNKIHEMHRDSSSLATYWRRKATTKEIEDVREMTESLASRYYDEASWKI